MTEREKIVAWLESEAAAVDALAAKATWVTAGHSEVIASALRNSAKAIERGDHLK